MNLRTVAIISAIAVPLGSAFTVAPASFVRRTALHVTMMPEVERRPTTKVPYFVDVTESSLRVEKMEEPVGEKKPVAPKKKPAGGSHGNGGLFAPAVLAAKSIMGEEALNKVRAKVIGKHSEVIGNFVDTSNTEFGRKVLTQLFMAADKNGNGQVEPEELENALAALGFSKFLKEKQMAGIFDRADVDHNGAIDLEEWIKAAPKTLRTNLIKLAKTNGGDLGFLA